MQNELNRKLFIPVRYIGYESKKDTLKRETVVVWIALTLGVIVGLCAVGAVVDYYAH
jgi:hypothetical protein